MTYRLVIFDFDGTLADSASWFVKALNDLAPRHGFRPVTAAEIEMLRGRGNREIIRYLKLARWRTRSSQRISAGAPQPTPQASASSTAWSGSLLRFIGTG